MTKRLIDIDDELLEAAQRELGTTGYSDTVRMALQVAAARSARAREIARLREGALRELEDAAERSQVWR